MTHAASLGFVITEQTHQIFYFWLRVYKHVSKGGRGKHRRTAKKI